ncbi:DNA alkylation repair protein [Vibrio ziniensis]|uniref:DNA alkylation repair protein n=1 Tax=Vibrio ziniensis TaxID=2711221 RepID=A0A6G7CNL8_9VIBR|nr:DNA alkylation repair protein [Vibrio ziniensis]QIH43699.1 DNA alkylation repair protein [Vibrio ziniensis]
MHPWNMSVKAVLEPLSDKENATQMRAYLRDQFQFYGVRSPQRRDALKPLFSKNQLPHIKDVPSVCRELWSLPQREFQLVAVDLLIKHRKALPALFLDEVEWLITTKSWWDTVDLLASHIVAAIFINYPEQTALVIERWRKADNMWLRRSAILYQLKFKQNTDVQLLFEIIKENQSDNEFFIQKATGWALRELSKTDPATVISFIKKQNIQGLAKREGLKIVNKTCQWLL